MNEREHEKFEADLRRLKPARLPDELAARLDAPLPMTARAFERRQRSKVWRSGWSFSLRWLAPATAAAVALLAFTTLWNLARNPAPPTTKAPAPMLKADQVEIDRQLIGSFDAVANMPEGEPVRFRFQQWMDAVTLRDSVRGLEVVQRTPRIEVVPVSFDTY